MSQTTSPATFILATIDACRRQMALHGRELLERTIELANDARKRLQSIPGIAVVDGPGIGVPYYDLTKLVIDVHDLGLTGFEVEDELRHRYQINPEMSDLTGIVCLVTLGDTAEGIDRLVHAFESIARTHRGRINPNGGAHLRSSGAVIAPGIQAMSPREAYFASSRLIPLADAAGEISAELVIPYPPGIPVLAPGDVITVNKLDYLKFGASVGMYISGASDHKLESIRVVEEIRTSAWLQQPYYSNLSHRG
jgi:arginine decarboxylase